MTCLEWIQKNIPHQGVQSRVKNVFTGDELSKPLTKGHLKRISKQLAEILRDRPQFAPPPLNPEQSYSSYMEETAAMQQAKEIVDKLISKLSGIPSSLN